MADPYTIIAILQFVGVMAKAVCESLDKAIDEAIQQPYEHEERGALKDLRKRVESLKSDTLVYKVLLNAMETDTDLSGRSPYTRFIQRYVMGCARAHILAELIVYNATDRTERKQWKALKERSRLPDYCSRKTQLENAMKSR